MEKKNIGSYHLHHCLFVNSLLISLLQTIKGQHLEQLQSNCECVDCPCNQELNIKDIFKVKET